VCWYYTRFKAINLLYLYVKTTWLNKVIFYCAVLVGCVIAFSPPEAGLQPQLNDKLLHTVGFFSIAVLCHLAHPKARAYLLVLGLALLGLAIEFVQAYLPYRTFSLWDWVADLSGILLYFLFIARIVIYKFMPD